MSNDYKSFTFQAFLSCTKYPWVKKCRNGTTQRILSIAEYLQNSQKCLILNEHQLKNRNFFENSVHFSCLMSVDFLSILFQSTYSTFQYQFVNSLPYQNSDKPTKLFQIQNGMPSIISKISI